MKRFIGYITTLAIIIGVAPPVSLEAQVNADIWHESITITEGESLTLEQATNRSDCEFKDVDIRKYRQPINTVLEAITGSEYTVENIGRKCVINNLQGYFTNQSYSREGRIAYELAPSQTATYRLDPAPSGEMTLVVSKQSYFHEWYSLGVVTDFINDSALHNGYTNVVWRFFGQTEVPIRDLNGNKVRIFDHTYSNNGRYLAIRFDRVVGVVDLHTLEMTPVGHFQSWSSSSELGVSNDGKHVVVSNNGLFVYGAKNCNRKYAYSQWDVTQYNEASGQYEGCTKSPDLRQNLMQQLGTGTPPWLTRLYFSPNNSELKAGVGVRQATAPPSASGPSYYDWAEYSFAADNYVSSAQGYLAMGDSFSSGEGDTEGGTWYEQGTDEQGSIDTFAGRNLCHLSRRSYPYLLANELGYFDGSIPVSSPDSLFHSVACSGAKIHNVVGGSKNGLVTYEANEDIYEEADNQYSNSFLGALDLWQPGRVKQLGYTEPEELINSTGNTYIRSKFTPGAITLGIGGNDVDFGGRIGECAGLGTCPEAVAGSKAAQQLALTIANMKPKLVDTFKQIKAANPDSRIYVHGYPIFVEGQNPNCGNNVPLNAQEAALVGKGVTYMNAIVQAAAQEAGVYYVDVTDILHGTNLCSGTEDHNITVNGSTAGNDQSMSIADLLSLGICRVRSGCLGKETFHPNPRAHERYQETIQMQTNNLTSPMPEPTPTDYPLPDVEFFGQGTANLIAGLNQGSDHGIVTPELRDILQFEDNSLSIFESGFLPESTVRAEIHSDPVEIGQYIADENGEIRVKFTIPDSIKAGVHQIHLFGIDSFGQEINHYEPIWFSTTAGDFDNDGIPDEQDSCKTMANINEDRDNDGIDDVCDLIVESSDNGSGEDTPYQYFCTKLEQLHLRLKEARPKWLFRHPKSLVKKLISYYCSDDVIGQQRFDRLTDK